MIQLSHQELPNKRNIILPSEAILLPSLTDPNHETLTHCSTLNYLITKSRSNQIEGRKEFVNEISLFLSELAPIRTTRSLPNVFKSICDDDRSV